MLTHIKIGDIIQVNGYEKGRGIYRVISHIRGNEYILLGLDSKSSRFGQQFSWQVDYYAWSLYKREYINTPESLHKRKI